MLPRPWRPCMEASCGSLHFKRGIADIRSFVEGDIVLLRRKGDASAPPILSRPLKPGRRIESHKGVVRHDDILGKRVRDLVLAQPKRVRASENENTKQKDPPEFRLHEVKLDEYVRLSRRLVTPIYPADARLIVDLLDLHPHDLLSNDSGEQLEILEAGTGHGALTLYLARAICGANVATPSPQGYTDEVIISALKSTRKAIVHTIDVSEKYSAHAESVVQGFRKGLYYPHVDFHVGDVRDWTVAEIKARGEKPFLSHAFLDLPNAEKKLDAVAKALRVDGTLIVFNPSITQIMDAAKKIRDDGTPLELEKVVELGVNGGSGGREWDVRPVRPRAVQKAALLEPNPETEDSVPEMNREEEQVAADDVKSVADSGWSMVCRPKVGERVVGGGFLGVWKKQRSMKSDSNSSDSK